MAVRKSQQSAILTIDETCRQETTPLVVAKAERGCVTVESLKSIARCGVVSTEETKWKSLLALVGVLVLVYQLSGFPDRFPRA